MIKQSVHIQVGDTHSGEGVKEMSVKQQATKVMCSGGGCVYGQDFEYWGPSQQIIGTAGPIGF